MTHIYHPDLGDPARPGILVDGCQDCEAAAKNPVQRLDRDFVKALWAKMVSVEHQPFTTGIGAHYASVAEATACGRLFTIAIFLERYGVIRSPWWEVRL